MDELVLHHRPFKLGDYVSVTRKRNDTKIVSYGVIKFIKYSYEKENFSMVFIELTNRQKFVVEDKFLLVIEK